MILIPSEIPQVMYMYVFMSSLELAALAKQDNSFTVYEEVTICIYAY